jgi:hypothetical protein
MTDWVTLAKAQGFNLPAAEAQRMVNALAALEQTFRPLTANLPPELEPASEFHMEDE